MFDVFFDQDNIWFTIPGALGSAVFMLKVTLMFIGLGDGVDGIGDVDVNLDFDGDIGDSDVAAGVLSIQSAAAFLMGLGWGGLFGKVILDQGTGISVMIGLATGALFVWVLVKMLTFVYRLQSSGNIPISAAMGKEGTVYAQIPSRMSGQGRVKVIIEDRKASGSITFEAPDLATKNWFTNIRSDNGHVTQVLAIVHGTVALNIVTIGAPAVQLSNMQEGESKGIVTYTFDMTLLPSAGNDELTITTT